ncbi:hypothetical protein P4418_12720 [Bacillus thuringiensis]|uniref:hypothetical protein n=2 Tax=Bacillus thuringiensis TaxID=1428 RepID=UPI001F55580B|nr:hypothetical protein [Bacillus thuringiensis]MED3389704.1 hypothetical protein [Bacillus thuringiensis]
MSGKKQSKPRKKSVNLIFRQEIDIAKTLASMTGVKEGIAYAVAMERAEQKTGEDFSSYKRLLPAATYKTGFLNPTQIGEQMGKKYGEEIPYTRNGHSGYQIKWSESVRDVWETEWE